ncbi:MAG: sigma-54-dependent transcriptional regulator, partial [Candidatus Binatia bacterium]
MTSNILIVDDDATMRKSLANLLGREGYVTVEAESGERAVECLRNDTFDLIVTDLHMEPMSGLDLLRAVKQSDPDIEVIVVTAYGTIEAAVAAMKLGAFDFVSKPFQVDEILLRVRNALEKNRLKEQVRRLQNEARSAFGIDGI